MTQPIAGPAARVREELMDCAKGISSQKARLRIYGALGLLATYPPDQPVVVTFMYQGTRREHVTVEPCHIIEAA